MCPTSVYLFCVSYIRDRLPVGRLWWCVFSARFCVGLIRIRNVISRRETRTEKSDRSSSLQEAWRWRVSTWPSRREFCVRRCCCWARPTRMCVLKSKFTPESWVRRLYQYKWYAGDLILLCQFPLQHIIACRWPFVIFFLTVGEVKVFTPGWFSACFQCALKKAEWKDTRISKESLNIRKTSSWAGKVGRSIKPKRFHWGDETRQQVKTSDLWSDEETEHPSINVRNKHKCHISIMFLYRSSSFNFTGCLDMN